MSNPPPAPRPAPGFRPFHAAVLCLVVALGLPLQGIPWAQPVGVEFHVTTYGLFAQEHPEVAADADGDFVVAWHGQYPDTTYPGIWEGIFCRRFTSAGVALGAGFVVNTYTTSTQRFPDVAADASGNFVVIWESYSQDGSNQGVFSRRYTSAGAAIGAEFQVNTYTTNAQRLGTVAADADGDFVVVWQSNLQDGSSFGVFGQRYTSAGAAIGAEFQVNTYTTDYQAPTGVAADADGDFVVVWLSNLQDGSSSGVFGQRYTSAGAAIGAEFQVNTYTTGAQTVPAVAADADGDFVVVWESNLQDGSSRGVFGQRYTSAGATIGAEFQVNTYTTNAQRVVAVAADADGDFVVVWESNLQDGSSYGVFGQHYTSAGAAVGAEFQVNTYTTNTQDDPAVAADADGDLVVIWESDLQDGSSRGVYGQRFQQPIGATTTTSTTTSTSTTTTLPPPIPMLSSPGVVLLAVLLMLPMVWGLRLRVQSPESLRARRKSRA